jgi:hypothetical protein
MLSMRSVDVPRRAAICVVPKQRLPPRSSHCVRDGVSARSEANRLPARRLGWNRRDRSVRDLASAVRVR